MRTISFILFFLISYFGFSQTNITNKDYEVTDDVVEMEEYSYKSTQDLSSPDLFYSKKFKFENGLIKSELTITDKQNIVSNYNYSNKEVEIEYLNPIYGNSKTTYHQIQFNGLKFYYPKTHFKVIQNNPNKLLEISYSIENTEIIRKFEIQKDNSIIESFGNSQNTYGEKGKKIKHTLQLQKLVITDYYYNEDGLLSSEIKSFKDYNSQNQTIIEELTYYYEKDTKGNWIKKLVITEQTQYSPMKLAFSSRKLTYKNGEVTGSLDFDQTYVIWETGMHQADKNYITKLKQSNPSTTIPNGLVWKKNSENTQYWLYNNNIRISGEGVTFYADNHLFVYLTLINEIYKLKDFKSLKANDYHEAELLPFNPTYGVWYKKTENEIIIYNNKGKQIKESEINQFAKNGIDYLVKVKGEETIFLLKGCKNAPLNTLYNIEVYKPLNDMAPSASTTIPGGLVWKKNSENTEVWLYDNGIEIDGTVFFVDNTLYFYEIKNDNIYQLDNFKAQKGNTYYSAIKLPHKYPHGAWIRWDAQGGLQAVNANGEIIRGNTIFKNAANNIDVIYKGKGEAETLFFKGFHNAKIKEVLPAEIYSPKSTTNLSNATNIPASSFQKEIDDCKNAGVNCLANKITDKYTALKNSGVNEDDIFIKLASDFNSIGAHNIKVLFDMIFKLDTNILPKEKYGKILVKMSLEQRENLKAYSQKIRDDYLKTRKQSP